MAAEPIFDRSGKEASFVDSLSAYLPYSLPLLRRLQFMHFAGGQTSNSHVLTSFDGDDPGRCFVAAYLDFSRGPETEMWLFSSIELNDRSPKEVQMCEVQILALIQRVRELGTTYKSARETPGILLIGALHEKIAKLFQDRYLILDKTPPNYKFIFEQENLVEPKPLPASLQWTVVQREDLPMILSKTDVPRKEFVKTFPPYGGPVLNANRRTMILLPSVAIKKTNCGELIAWAFLGPDGSLTTLHCEPLYRGQGLAKEIAQKIFREKSVQYGSDGLNHADVLFNNIQSQGVCKSLGGSPKWKVHWVWLDLTKNPLAESVSSSSKVGISSLSTN